MNIVPIKRPPSDLAAVLRDMADRVDAGAITEMLVVRVENGSYEFMYGASLADSIVMASLLLHSCVERMKR